ncbi:MAG: ATP-binding protein [Chlamydiia bacterium]
MNIPRQATKRLLQLAETFPAIVVTGPRQAGKSTLLRSALPGASVISLDDITVLAEVQADPVLAISLYPAPLIIDEVQYLPLLFRVIKVAVDRERTHKGRFFLAGSQIFELMAGSVESLAGRAGFLHLWPLSWVELAPYEDPRKLSVCISRMLDGFYPEVVTGADRAQARRWMENYVLSVVERDLRQIKAIEDLGVFGKFLRLLALRAGQLLNVTNLAGDVGVGATTITSWLSLLETVGIGFRLQPYFNNLGKRLVKTPKWYFMDTGVLCYLLGLRTDDELIRSGDVAGHVFENMVVVEIYKRCSADCYQPPLTFYRTQEGEEVDLILETPTGLYAYEIKFSASAGRKEAGSLQRFVTEFGQLDRPVQAQLLCLTEEGRPVFKGVEICHWSAMRLPSLDQEPSK